MFKVRFHLARGKFYKFWQVKDLKNDTGPFYFNPNSGHLIMEDCTLYVNENKAKRIHEAGIKDVCGWIKCRHVFFSHSSLFTESDFDNFPRLSFNPIVDVNWRISISPQTVMNNTSFEELVTKGNKVYVPTFSMVQ